MIRGMATYPPVTDLECDAAVARIANRHARHDDPRWSEAGTEARDVLAYLRRHHSHVPRTVAAQDVWDELVLSAWVHWDELRRERELLHRARRYGLSLAELGRFLGIGTRQGARDYLDRLDALLAESHGQRSALTEQSYEQDEGRRHGDPRREPPPGIATSFVGRSRASRGAAAQRSRDRRRATRTRPTREAWIAHHRPRIATIAAELLAQAARLGHTPSESEADQPAGLTDYLAWLAEDLATNEIGTGVFATLGLILGELRTAPTVTERAGNHGIHQVIATVDQLRADYAALTQDRAAAQAGS
jgi:hypothetical protein